MVSTDVKESITDISDIYSKGRFHGHFSYEPACPSPRGFTIGSTASRSRAGSSRATSNSNFVIDEGSIITDEMIRGINKPVVVLQTK
jgi:hypothetical protein